ncbi:urea ABC transporter permease subunit UrtB [Paraburkholderia sp. FT54]|uniref:urea ABC transporter permease subunit UrtB n=1 Tax=Paraburkholderia sp. FT54 TaxID=3074437 RepID=UPI00287806BB|nr:urea ABC transporter permease subunit UrtB [Paraburkholderia sp. FT54]WNC92321.1 urea ABC transporter permease subunit UrtB [Paraburkholderia sp. FT54]
MINFRQLFFAIACLALVWATTANAAPSRAAMLTSFCATDGDKAAALEQVVEAGVSDDTHERAWARQIVDAIRNGALQCGADGQATLQGNPALDAATLQPRANGPADSPYVPSIVMMRKLAVVSAEMDLFSPQQDTRATAARQVDKFFALLDPAIVARAVRAQNDPDIATVLRLALAKRGLNSNVKADRLAAIKAVAEVPSETARTALANFAEQSSVRSDPDVLAAVQGAIRNMDTWLSLGKGLSILFSGLSYAGVLLLTALGLSIVFGLMGVINLAHGEFIMIGAYATYLVERFMQAHLPGLFDAYIFVAIPVAFVICAACGMLLEFFVIRFLYRRPLETLLATWAVSIALIKLIQVLFGSQNVEFITPGFLNGGMQVAPGFFVTYNRVFAIVLAVLIFVATFAVVRFTKLGLLMRATTQLRDMARCLGVPAERVDRIAFGLGAGLAGLAGVVLTQIASVNPSMGTGFVVDSFMVVVLGGAGSLAGTVVSSLALGEINQFIEPFYGAVAAKVAVLLLIVLIIQKRPQGLFALKTRV